MSCHQGDHDGGHTWGGGILLTLAIGVLGIVIALIVGILSGLFGSDKH